MTKRLSPELLSQIQAVKKALKNHAEIKIRTTWELHKRYLEEEGWTWETYKRGNSYYRDLVRKYFFDE